MSLFKVKIKTESGIEGIIRKYEQNGVATITADGVDRKVCLPVVFERGEIIPLNSQTQIEMFAELKRLSDQDEVAEKLIEICFFYNLTEVYFNEIRNQKKNKYKLWEVIRVFENHWDLEADDLGSMLRRALRGTDSLLHNIWYQPFCGLYQFADSDNYKETLRKRLRELLLSKDSIQERVKKYIFFINEMVKIYCNRDKYFQDIQSTSLLMFLFVRSNYWFDCENKYKLVVSKKDGLISFEDFYRLADKFVEYLKRNETLDYYIKERTILNLKSDNDFLVIVCDILRREDLEEI